MLKRLSPRARALLGVALLLLITYLAIRYAPPEGESNNVTGDLPQTPTVVVTNQRSTLLLQRGVDLGGLHVVVKQAILASAFSDDRKRNGLYTVRILVDVQNKTRQPLGYPFADNVHLLLPDGTPVATKLISVKALLLPDQVQSGFLDFPLQASVELSQLKLQFMSNSGLIVVPLRGGG